MTDTMRTLLVVSCAVFTTIARYFIAHYSRRYIAPNRSLGNERAEGHTSLLTFI